MKKSVLILLLMILIPAVQVSALDTDIYVLTNEQAQVKPDALFVFDLSGSMRWTPAGEKMYIQSGQNCGSDVAYYTNSASPHTKSCSIDPYGTVPKYSDSTCSGPFYRTSGSEHTTDCSRIEIAKRTVRYVLDDNEDGTVNVADEESLKIRFGYLRFSNGNDTAGLYSSGYIQLIQALGTSYSSILSSVNAEIANSGTPLASALNEARLYLNADKVADDARDCRQKFVILISDGADTYICSGNGTETQSTQYKRRRAIVARAKALADAGYKVFVVGFGSDMPYYLRNTLNWAAYYGQTINRLDTQTGDTNAYDPASITDFCNNASTNWTGDHYRAVSSDPGEIPLSGYAFIATNATELSDSVKAIANYIAGLMEEATSYVAPVVPVSQFERFSSGDRLYLGMFKPASKSFWKGNIKKFGLATVEGGGTEIGDILDKNGNPAITTSNQISSDSVSYWSTTADGDEVEKGGVGVKLLERTTPRNIYTYLSTNPTPTPNLTDPSNAFILTNSGITPESLGLNAGDTTGREKLINFIHGLDSYDWNGPCGNPGPNEGELDDVPDGNTTAKRCWILGSIIHSRPVIIHYATDQSVIFVGANDGMLHAFDDASGEELWAFIPPGLLPSLKNLNGSLIQFFADGAPKPYIQRDASGNLVSATLIFGLRRGGNRYIALDVTNRLAPRFLYEISPSTAGFEELGQTWSAPQIGKIRNGTGVKWVGFIGGGYDENQDEVPVILSDTKGRAVYVFDSLTGQLVWKYSHAENPGMSYSIPSDIARLDTDGDGKIDRLYVGDTGGRMWRFDIGDAQNTAAWSGSMIFTAPTGRKIFHPPDVTLENDAGEYERVLFGTGDRENPKDTSGIDRLYSLKDKLPYPHTPMTESDMENVTLDLLQDPNTSSSEKATILNNLKTKHGWYILLNQRSGEKSLSTPVVFAGGAFFTTYAPPVEGGICFLNEGTGYLYLVNYKTGNAADNLDLTNDTMQGENLIKVLQRSDRTEMIGEAIPSAVIITIIGEKAVGYAGIGGGIDKQDPPEPKPLIPINWRIVF